MAKYYTLFKDTGKEFTGNISEIALQFNISRATVSTLIKQDISSLEWRIQHPNARSKRNNPTFTIFKGTPEEFTGTKKQICQHFRVSMNNLYHFLREGYEIEEIVKYFTIPNYTFGDHRHQLRKQTKNTTVFPGTILEFTGSKDDIAKHFGIPKKTFDKRYYTYHLTIEEVILRVTKRNKRYEVTVCEGTDQEFTGTIEEINQKFNLGLQIQYLDFSGRRLTKSKETSNVKRQYKPGPKAKIHTVFHGSNNEFTGSKAEIAKHFNVSIHSLRAYCRTMDIENALIKAMTYKKIKKYTVFANSDNEFTGSLRDVCAYFSVCEYSVRKYLRTTNMTLDETIIYLLTNKNKNAQVYTVFNGLPNQFSGTKNEIAKYFHIPVRQLKDQEISDNLILSLMPKERYQIYHVFIGQEGEFIGNVKHIAEHFGIGYRQLLNAITANGMLTDDMIRNLQCRARNTTYILFKGTDQEFCGTKKEIANHFNISYPLLTQRAKINNYMVTDDMIIELQNCKHLVRKEYTVFAGTEDEFTGTRSAIAKHFNISLASITTRMNNGLDIESAIKYQSPRLMTRCKSDNKDFIEVVNLIKTGLSEDEAINMVTSPYDESNIAKYKKASKKLSYDKQAQSLGFKDKNEWNAYNRYLEKHGGQGTIEEFRKIKEIKMFKKKELQEQMTKRKTLLNTLSLKSRDFNQFEEYYNKGYTYEQYLEMVFKEAIEYNGPMNVAQILDYALDEGEISRQMYNVLQRMFVEKMTANQVKSELHLSRQRIYQLKNMGIININRLFNPASWVPKKTIHIITDNINFGKVDVDLREFVREMNVDKSVFKKPAHSYVIKDGKLYTEANFKKAYNISAKTCETRMHVIEYVDQVCDLRLVVWN